MAKQPESILVSRGILALRGLGATAIKIHGSVYAREGEPDVLGCFQGRSFAIEAKQPGKHPTPIQRVRLKEWADSGAITGVAHTVEEFLSILEEGMKTCPSCGPTRRKP